MGETSAFIIAMFVQLVKKKDEFYIIYRHLSQIEQLPFTKLS